jgi:hypothetical protein
MKKAKHRTNGEIKKNVGIALTDTALSGLDSLAATANVSRSHLIEMIGRGDIPVRLLSAQSLGESLSN